MKQRMQSANSLTKVRLRFGVRIASGTFEHASVIMLDMDDDSAFLADGSAECLYLVENIQAAARLFCAV